MALPLLLCSPSTPPRFLTLSQPPLRLPRRLRPLLLLPLLPFNHLPLHHSQHNRRRRSREPIGLRRNPDPVKALPCSGPLPFDPSSIAYVWNKNFGAFCRKIRSFLWIVGQFSAGDDGMQHKFGALRFGIVVSLSLFFVLGSRSAALASSQSHDATAAPVSVRISHQKDSGASVSSSASAISHVVPEDNQVVSNGFSTGENGLDSDEQREYLACNEKYLVRNEYAGAGVRLDSESNVGNDATKEETVLNEQGGSNSCNEGPTQATKNEDENFEELDNHHIKGSIQYTPTQQTADLQVVAKGMDKELESWRTRPYMLTVPLRVISLRGSVPPTWILDFRRSQGKRVRTTVETQGSLDAIMSALSTSLEKKQVKPQSIMAADVVTIGDSWLQSAVSKGLIEPIENAEQYDWFQRLSSKWQAYLRRNREGQIDKHGQIWGVPYRCGSMVVAFRKDKMSRNNAPGIEDWDDLWRPELIGRIAMVNSPREVVGAVLKSLGASYNACDFEKEVEGGKEAVKQRFIAFRKQVKLFDSTHYLKALASDDVWVAVGWSSDVIPMAKRMSNMRVIAPKSGTSVWADLWAIPAASAIPTDKIGSRVYRASPLVQQWLDFCLQPARAEPFRQGVHAGSSPLSYFSDMEILKDDEDNPRSGGPTFDTNLVEGIPPKFCMEKSEFLEPLSDKGVSDYEWLFAEVKEEESRRKGFLKSG